MTAPLLRIRIPSDHARHAELLQAARTMANVQRTASGLEVARTALPGAVFQFTELLREVVGPEVPWLQTISHVEQIAVPTNLPFRINPELLMLAQRLAQALPQSG